VTLERLVLAWLPVAVVFIVIGGLGTRFYSASGAEPQRVDEAREGLDVYEVGHPVALA